MFWSATAFVHYQLTLVVHLAGQSQHLFYCVVLTFSLADGAEPSTSILTHALGTYSYGETC